MAKKVFIGVGHGGSDPGSVKYITEKEYTLKTAKAVSEYLEDYGIEYKLSRTSDIEMTGIRPSTICDMCNNNCTFLKIDNINKICNKLNCSIEDFISIIFTSKAISSFIEI